MWDWDRLRALALRETRALLNEPQDAADAAQEAVLRAWRFAHSCRTPERPEPWMRAIARREALRRLQRDPREDSLDDAGPQEHTDLLDRDGTLDLRRALGEMHPQDRTIFLMHYWGDASCAEISTALGMPTGTVKIRLYRGRRTLEQSLKG